MIKIYEENSKEEDVYLRLFQNGRLITLCCVDSNGDKIPGRATILVITKDGLCRFRDLGEIGFELEEDGKIKLNENKEKEHELDT